jgi:hypothetical protein
MLIVDEKFINCLFFYNFKSTQSTTSRTGDTARTIEFELKQNGPYILAGLGVSGGLLLLANRNIPAISIPILSSAADRVACRFHLKFFLFENNSRFFFFRCSSMDWSRGKNIHLFQCI